jgi:hypothetical protein
VQEKGCNVKQKLFFGKNKIRIKTSCYVSTTKFPAVLIRKFIYGYLKICGLAAVAGPRVDNK